MKVEYFSFGLDENNKEYVEFIEKLTKTRQFGLSAKPRSFLPKMFATGGDRCLITIFKEFLSHRPTEICDPPRENREKGDNTGVMPQNVTIHAKCNNAKCNNF